MEHIYAKSNPRSIYALVYGAVRTDFRVGFKCVGRIGIDLIAVANYFLAQ